MVEDLKELYKAELVEISDHLTKEECKKLLYYCTDYISESSSSSFSTPEIFWRLEEKEKISYEKVGFLTKFADKIGRKDLVTKLNRFEITRELMIFALNRQGLGANINSSTTSVGHRLAEMVDIVQDRVDVRAQGMINSLLRSGKNVSNILDEIIREAVPGSDETQNWNDLALCVVIAADIVWLVLRENQESENDALQVAIELASHLWSMMAKVGKWVSGI